jgi:lipopolysaccharide export system protein LptA
MRGARWLLLVAMAVIVSAVGVQYRDQKRALKRQALPKPAVLPASVGLDAEQWTYTRYDKDNHTIAVEIVAKDARQAKDSTQTDLTGVRLKLHHQHQDTYDLVTSPAATYYSNDERLYSDGQVDIVLAVPSGEEPNPKLTTIHSSGVNYDTNTGKAQTDRPATFTFRNGNGKAVGASYDPNTHELRMYKDVEMDWYPPGPNAKPMKIETTSLYYHEAIEEVWLKPWGRLTRGNTVVEGYESVIRLEDKSIRSVETIRAHGTDDYPNRKLQYAADHIWANFDDDGVVDKIIAEGNAQLTSRSEATETTMTAAHVEMNFQSQNGESVLTSVNASGNSMAKEAPLPAPGREPGETHVLRSESIGMVMQPGGKDIQTVKAPGTGNLEFLPNLPTQHHRVVIGKDFLIAYGPQNHLDTFHATGVTTSTDPTEDERKRNIGVTHTASRDLFARFQPDSNDVATIDQTGDFTYEQGLRHATAKKATFDNKANVMVLDGAARVSDDTGSTTAGLIHMDQRTGDFTAEGDVKSMRLPDKGQTKSGMLNGDEPMQAQAHKMRSSNRDKTTHYEGDVRLWQGANRIQAATIDVDRQKSTLVADGNVISDLWEQPKDKDDTGEDDGSDQKADDSHKQDDSGKKGPAVPIRTLVKAPHLVYTDSDRLAIYTGGVVLNRLNTQVKAKELHAYLAEEGADSRLIKAIADGNVEIDQTVIDRTRVGKAEHCEYYTENQKVVLRGGAPEFVDSLKGNAHGIELTYFANDDRLLVNGSPEQPAKSRIKRR